MKQTDQRTTVKAVSNKIIGGSLTRALSPRRWGKQNGRSEQSNCIGYFPFSTAAPKFFGRAARRVSPQTGRSMVEMLAVLAIIGVLSVAALAGLTYAMNKHRANTIYNDVHLLALHVMDTGKDTVPADFYPDSGKTFTLDTTTYADGFVVKVADISEKVCNRIMEVNDPSIEKIYVGSEETTNCSGTQTMGFMFLYDGTFTSGSSSGGSGTDPVDPCEGVIASTDCSISADETDSNGCVTVKKITCTGDTYCSGSTCEPCPAAETCAGESCCALTGPNDVCGRPTKEVGTVTTVTHSDLNANGCCETTTEESCSLNPVTPRTCAPTCDGTCESDGSCRPTCETGYSYNETAGQCCADLTETDCQKLVPASSGVCPRLEHVSTEGFPCTTTDGQSGTCQSGVCEVTVTCTANTYVSGSACLSCGSGAVSDGTTAMCACDTENGFTGTWTAPATGSDDNGCTQGSTCTSNANCKSGYFCAFQNTSSCSDQGMGECRLISAYAPDSTTAAGFIRSTNNMTWWSAQNWCTAQDRTPATRASIGCSGVESNICSSDTVDAFKSAWGEGYGWLDDYGNSCNAYYAYLGSGRISGTNRSYTNFALCR